MRPILLHGHERSLTKIKYNRDGDLLFSVSKDKQPNVWYSHNGERLGTFNGHEGAVWDLDVSSDSKYLLTGSADNSCRLWSVYTGKELFSWNTQTAVRRVAFAEGDRKALFVTDSTMGQPCRIFIVPIQEDISTQNDEPLRVIELEKKDAKATVAGWGDLNTHIYTGHEDGSIRVWDAETGELIKNVKAHRGTLQDLQFSKDKSHFITASKDHTAKVFDSKTLKVLKEFSTERNVNSAAISPLKPHIILGGGQEAMSVTTTAVKQGKFEVRFFHKIFEDEIGRVKGHFGPINTLAWHPDGRSFASGGEDGYVRVHFLDEDYFKFAYDEEK